MRILCLILLLLPGTTLAEIVVPTRVIRAKEIIAPGDVAHKSGVLAGALASAEAAIGQEARIALYPGRAIRAGDVGAPAIVERNDLVTLIYAAGGLRIATEGRVLGRGAIGETVRVMNLGSRVTVTGLILADGTIEVR